jgi:hypothetical protein
MLDENDVVKAVVEHLKQQGFMVQFLHTTQRGIDIIANHRISGELIFVEAKGGTSSRVGSPRYGKVYDKSQVFDRVAKGIYTLLQMHGNRKNDNDEFALAVPDTLLFNEYLKPIKDSLNTLGLKVFLVNESKEVVQL